MPVPPNPAQPTQPGKGVEWGRPGPRLSDSYGIQFGPQGGATRTGDPAEARPITSSPSRIAAEGPRQIIYSLSFRPDRHSKLPPLSRQAQPVVLKGTQQLPWAEVDGTNFLVILKQQVGENLHVGVVEMTRQAAGDPVENLKSLIALAQAMHLPIDHQRGVVTDTHLQATIVGGKRAEPLMLKNTLTQYVHVNGDIPRYSIPEKGSMPVVIDALGNPMLLTDVPADLLKPIETPNGLPSVRRGEQI